ncbi:MAG: hypothetical protein GC134_01310 [Proteobacteria bacterium]|nr:hypothetical protein [Pseudomonadota bacterium]
MAYTIIFIARDSTHNINRTFNVSRPAFWGVIGGLIAAPFATFVLALFYLAPASYEARMNALRDAVAAAKKELAFLQGAYDAVVAERDALKQNLSQEREQRAAAEAVTAIADNARATTSARMQDLENQVFELGNKVKLYDSFLRPEEQSLPLQCFNLKVNYDQPKNRLMYNVSFLKTDQKDKRSVDIEVRFQVLSGIEVVGLDDAIEDADRIRKTSLTQERQLSGILRTKLASEGMRILDVKAYGKDESLMAHCWKAF